MTNGSWAKEDRGVVAEHDYGTHAVAGGNPVIGGEEFWRQAAVNAGKSLLWPKGTWGVEDVVRALEEEKDRIAQSVRDQPSPAQFFDVDDLIMSATSYYLGRMTANVGDFCRRLVQAWPNLKLSTRDYIQRIVEHEFDRESIAKRHGLSQNVFGMDCDREAWEKVRACWSGTRSGFRP